MNINTSALSSPASRKRINWIDMAKGYGIICIMLGHVSIIWHNVFTFWLATFHVPLFFLLSGYVFSTKLPFKAFLKHKCKTMLIPYFLLGIVMSFFGAYLNGDAQYSPAILLGYNFTMLVAQIRYGTIWFLACLFFLNLIFYGAVKLLKTNTKLAICSLVLAAICAIYYKLGGPGLPWNVDACLAVFPFFFVGYFLKQYQEKIDDFLSGSKKTVPLFFLFLIINMVCGIVSYLISNQPVDMFYNEYGCPPLFYISAFAGIGWVIILSRWFVFKPIRYIGEHSLLYFAWHQAIFLPISVFLLDLIGMHPEKGATPGLIIIYVILQILITVGLLTLCHLGISKTKLKIMIGK